MKKLLYLIPFLLLALCATPFALYKDTVSHGSSLDTASPGHWKVLDMDISFSGGLDSSNLSETDPNDSPEPQAYSQGASFKGFPFGAYFSRSASSNTSNLQSSYSVSAWSWLWSGIDLLIIASAFFFVYRANKKNNLI